LLIANSKIGLGRVVARKGHEEFGVSAYGLKLYGRGDKSAANAAKLAKLVLFAIILSLLIALLFRLPIFL
jgi:hypothetical protein